MTPIRSLVRWLRGKSEGPTLDEVYKKNWALHAEHERACKVAEARKLVEGVVIDPGAFAEETVARKRESIRNDCACLLSLSEAARSRMVRERVLAMHRQVWMDYGQAKLDLLFPRK